MIKTEVFRQALLRARSIRGEMIKLSDVMSFADFIYPEDIILEETPEDNLMGGHKRVTFKIKVSNHAIENPNFDVLHFVIDKTKVAYLRYKKIKRCKPISLVKDYANIFMKRFPGDDFTEAHVMFHAKPIEV